jgi:DNA-binding NarL/FixJ family response regulator
VKKEKAPPLVLSLIPPIDPKILIADDHPILLKGLYDFLKDLGFQTILKASNGTEALKRILESKPDLAILDLDMPGMTGIEIASYCESASIPTKIILLTLHKEIYLYQQAKELNLSGYILKDFALDDLSKAITTVLSGEQFFSEQLFKDMNINQTEIADYNLTPSEIKILRLISQGLSTKEIAAKLFISERTIEKHRSNMIAKLQLGKKHNSLMIWAQQNKFSVE